MIGDLSNRARYRLLLVIDTLQTGGAERSTFEIASRIQSFDVIVGQLYQGDMLSQNYPGLRLINLGLNGSYQFIEGISKFRRLLRKERPDLVMATLLRTELIARVACKLEGIPIIGTFVNDTYSPYEFATIPRHLRWKTRFFQLWNALTARWCVGFLANSESIKVSNAKALGIPLDKIKVIHRGRNLDAYTREREARMAAPFTFLNVGRLIQRKGQRELIEGFARFQVQYPGSILRIAGEGPYRGVLEKTIHDLGVTEEVQLLGNVHDVPAYLAKADAFVFPSYYEGFSGALVEAMLAGTPILASDTAMNREAAPSEMAQFFPVMSADGVFEALMAFAADTQRASRRAELAREYAREHYDIERIVAQHEAAYQYFLERARP